MIAALSHLYPDLDRVIKEHTNSEGRAVLERLERMTTVGACIRMAKKDVNIYLDRPLDEILAMPEVQYVFDNIKLGKATPKPPVLLVQAVHDYLIAVEDIDELAHTYMAGGTKVTYHRDAFNEHLLLHPLSAPMTLRWLQDRFAGRPLTDHLVRTTWPTMFNPATYVGHGAAGRDRGQGDHRKGDPPPPAMSARTSAHPRAADKTGRRPDSRRDRRARLPRPVPHIPGRWCSRVTAACRRSATACDRRTPAAPR